MKRTNGAMILAALMLGGCSENPPSPPPAKPASTPFPPVPTVQIQSNSPIVSAAEMEAFLETVKKGNLPAMWKTGDQIFQQNRFVPDHATRFKGVPSSEPQPGQLCYILYSFKGITGTGEISLLLDKSTGKIAKFTRMEASF